MSPLPIPRRDRVIRVVVVDDEPMVCAHLRTILGSAPDIEVADQAHDGGPGSTPSCAAGRTSC
jgi:DNA-binding NarL/FixJ family response regulator